MDKNAIKKYAVWARRELLSRVAQKALQYGVDGTTPADPDAEIINGRLLTAAEKSQRHALIDAIAADGYEQILEETAYTWFNRFCALRFMEVNNYLPSHTRVFTDENNAFAPQILTEAIRIELPGLDRDLVYKYKEANDDDALYKYLLITQCNALKEILPGMFSEISVYTELLFPDNLLREGSAVEQMIAMIPEDDWRDEVQIIGWLYQYYNSEKKDAVFAALKKNVKISKDNIPAATQLFTPDWIVRYMVENSLGRLWVQGHPAAPIKAEWKYYLEDAAQTPEVEARLAPLRQSYAALTPEQLTCIDPCCGSGHILVYLFDVLMQIYTDYGYTSREAVESIVQNNLYGLDIDKRAAQLAYFAVMMTARRHDRGFLRHPVQPHVYAIAESNAVDKGAVEVFCNGDAKLTAAVAQILTEMHDAREYGSILTTTPQDWAALYARFEELGVNDPDNHSMEKCALLKLQNVVQAAEILSKQYWVTVTNPPYMGASNMNTTLSNYVKEQYPDVKSDFFSVFVVRNSHLTRKDGYCGFFTPYVWMFISSYEKLRQYLYSNTTIETLIQFEYSAFEEATVPVCTFAFRNSYVQKNGCYLRLVDFRGGMEVQRQKTLQAIADHNCGYYYEQSSDNFSKIPGSPVAYWASENFFDDFDNPPMDDFFEAIVKGIFTGDNARFLRHWFEVAANKIDEKWKLYNKGGDFRKWYGNIEYVVEWENNGAALRNFEGSGLGASKYFGKETIVWTKLTSYKTGFRIGLASVFFDDASPALVECKKSLFYFLALLNSSVSNAILSMLSPTLNYQCGEIKKVPVIYKDEIVDNVCKIAQDCVKMEAEDWDSFETSWDFKRHPLV
jgi:hypothetical protein